MTGEREQDRIQRLMNTRHTFVGYDARAHCAAHGIDEQTAQPSFMEVALVSTVATVVLKALQNLDREEVRDLV